ncbi:MULTISPECIES: sacsin N-terminal ATP-binding-like domain-containing protein [Gammaproteobacteria]|uniref:sacsin N-terminal ATP-binding-like domain-containing protein n=1 Tax=Gammaproteobacteria TaxID=1236 RepID=UPI001911FA49|nr:MULTISPECIES: hypothetical protein [Gammaproteobacteria]MBK5303805.1 hypothetical protein [Bacillus sp. TH86]MBK5323574.1 hypothetical protein [Bacillus sp. TH59]MBK5338524.1 hypothetical protein [Bacillus sp. TH57]MBK5318072.1 hypothetical protein [Erwinia sp. TH79]MBK5422932.1 hypothetical protein [Erwinia sp. TH29]
MPLRSGYAELGKDDMKGFTTNFVNLIADNLRDRYDSGFPILKELIQNADDAEAREFVFGSHPGFPEAIHPLLQGPALWFYNDGNFKESDSEALRSFGINTKAGDSASIGKFGLGMKSVFHLCEALFYVAWDGQHIHLEGLTPWKSDGRTPHPEWDKLDAADRRRLEAVVQEMRPSIDADSASGCFLLWIPLRQTRHLFNSQGGETDPIIAHFPGDNPSRDLAFLDGSNLKVELAQILPLLHHLERIEHRTDTCPFIVQLKADRRLLSPQNSLPPICETNSKAAGFVDLGGGDGVHGFAGVRRESQDSDDIFSRLKSRSEWPRARYRNDLGRECVTLDKARAEAAAMFCDDNDSSGGLDIEWAVFLPLEHDRETHHHKPGTRHHRLVLHGQFFIDAGRKGIHGFEHLHEKPKLLAEETMDDAILRTTWNQYLTQSVLLPLVLPALEHYVVSSLLADKQCEDLTNALANTHWFIRFRSLICGSGAWVRMLERRTKPAWRRIETDRVSQLRPLPTPPMSDTQRPWYVFPHLERMQILPFDQEATPLIAGKPGWQEEEIHDLLSAVPNAFSEAPRIQYLAKFLSACAGPYKGTEKLRNRIITLIREGFRDVGLQNLTRHGADIRRLVEFIPCLSRSSFTAKLPADLVTRLWSIASPILLVPKELDSEDSPGNAVPDGETLARWLGIVDQALDASLVSNEMPAILDFAQGLLKSFDNEARGKFLRTHRNLRVLAVRNVRTRSDLAVSGEDIERVRNAGTLFGFASGASEVNRLGLTPLLALALPDAEVYLVRTETYRDLFPGQPELPRADDGLACLISVGKDATDRLGLLADRQALLEKANNPGADTDARRGLRYLLHGSPAHRADDEATLWIPGHEQHSAWAKLWKKVQGEDPQWGLLDGSLADTMPRSRWSLAGIKEVDAGNLIGELQRAGMNIGDPSDFSSDERDEILSRIEDENLWKHLPLHRTRDGKLVSLNGERTYCAPKNGYPDDALSCEVTLIAPSGHPLVAAQQKKWLEPFNDRARIKIALAVPEPSRHWRTILDALVQVGGSSVSDNLYCVAWLPTRQGAPVKPEDVIDIPHIQEEVQRLVAAHRAVYGQCFAAEADLPPELLKHPGFELLMKRDIANEEDGLGKLALLLDDLPEYHIGSWSGELRKDVVALFDSCELLPGWRLLHQAAQQPLNEEIAWRKLQRGIARPLTSERLFMVLDWLTTHTDHWGTRKATYDQYLRQYTTTPDIVRSRLGELHLANQRMEWRPTSELCAGAHGVDAAYLLDMQQAQILIAIVHSANRPTSESDCPGGVSAKFNLARKATPGLLESYFRLWGGGLVPELMIGMLVALFGRSTRELAESWLHPHSFGWLLKQLPWQDPGYDDTGRLEWMGSRSFAEALELIEVAVRVVEETQLEVSNLLGEPRRVPLNTQPLNLLAGALNWRGGFRVEIPLRRINPARHTPQELEVLLRGTIESLYADLYNQRLPNLGSLWQELDRTDQLEIGAAHRLILDSLHFYLRQLSVGSEAIKTALRACDIERTKIAEAEADQRDAPEARAAQRKAMESLAELIGKDREIQTTVLHGVRSKLEDYQYDSTSIPFELFQNADDAVMELGQIVAYPAEGIEIPDASRRLIVEVDGDTLRFMHWGRPINARGPVGFGGDARGYGHDLEKMLILSASDKQKSQGVTGKFGLGFKSVLLACDRPRIVSGRMAVEVVAGILPQPWEAAGSARECLARHSLDQRLPGTLIELPLLPEMQPDKILQRFRRLAGLSCVFGQTIRFIVINRAEKEEFEWTPGEVVPGLEHGQLAVSDKAWGTNTDALCLRGTYGSVLLALGPVGCRPLPKDLPALWVTAPTREQAYLGFAVNGAFDLDAGRGRLAGNSDSNKTLARNIGRQAGETLSRLLDEAGTNWPAMRERLRLAADLTSHGFWISLWRLLTQGWLNRPHDAAVELTRAVALDLLKCLSDMPEAIPNGLPIPAQRLISAQDIRYEMADELVTPEVLALLFDWKRFNQRYPAISLVSREIGTILKQGTMAKPATLGVTALVGLLDPPRVEPEDALVLGHIISRDSIASESDSRGLRERLQKLQFRTQANSWAEVGRLLANDGSLIEQEESLRHNLAPSQLRLHKDYYFSDEDATAVELEFFRLCRGGMAAPAEDMAKWVLSPEDEETKRAALIYLCKGNLRIEVSQKVRGQGWLADVLNDETSLRMLQQDERDVLNRFLATDEQIARVVLDDWDKPKKAFRSSIDLPTALVRIHDWWSSSDGAASYGSNYHKDLYPCGTVDLQENPETGRFDRSSWLTLFALGAFQSIGQTGKKQHRGFIDHCQQRGWWKIFAERNPKEQPDDWMWIIEDYAESQHDDEKWLLWIGQFPKLYRLARWLDDYVELFKSVDKYTKPFSLEQLRTPRANALYQGGGIDAPPINRTLKVGAHLVMRELLHHGVIHTPLAIPHAYAPIERIKILFGSFDHQICTSEDIYKLLREHLGAERATFGDFYDIPLRIIAENDDLQSKLFN